MQLPVRLSLGWGSILILKFFFNFLNFFLVLNPEDGQEIAIGMSVFCEDFKK